MTDLIPVAPLLALLLVASLQPFTSLRAPWWLAGITAAATTVIRGVTGDEWWLIVASLSAAFLALALLAGVLRGGTVFTVAATIACLPYPQWWVVPAAFAAAAGIAIAEVAWRRGWQWIPITAMHTVDAVGMDPHTRTIHRPRLTALPWSHEGRKVPIPPLLLLATAAAAAATVTPALNLA